jgi:hypothetical protein
MRPESVFYSPHIHIEIEECGDLAPLKEKGPIRFHG